jgi:hypothetical protein
MLVRAGDRAVMLAAPAEALRYFTQALDFTDDVLPRAKAGVYARLWFWRIPRSHLGLQTASRAETSCPAANDKDMSTRSQLPAANLARTDFHERAVSRD